MHPRLPPRSSPLCGLAVLALLAALPLGGCGGMSDVEDFVVGGSSPEPAAAAGTVPSTDSAATGMSAVEEDLALEVFALLNDERRKAGLPPLQWHDGAAAVAKGHCDDMDARDFFAHINPDGVSPGGRLTAGGVGWRNVGENIARGYPNPASVMQGWMNSEGHRANILHDGITHVGVGVRLASGGPWWTQVFLTPW